MSVKLVSQSFFIYNNNNKNGINKINKQKRESKSTTNKSTIIFAY